MSLSEIGATQQVDNTCEHVPTGTWNVILNDLCGHSKRET
jgi:hypothetical protein